mmetsp:Transcript_30623/g.88775  ORF Transcript_30623/g.88775 Transcript_30623/m.88775 type:complete len:611 (-) Transcript_30623:580-2412(-)
MATAVWDHSEASPKFVPPELRGAEAEVGYSSEAARTADEQSHGEEAMQQYTTSATTESEFLDIADDGGKHAAPDASKPGAGSASGNLPVRTTRAFIGFCAQYFAVGIIYGGIPATVYGVFLGYLNVPSYVYATVAVISMLPWSFKFLFGLINDTMPIMGLHRKPYMMFGWGFCAVALLVLSHIPLPPPYWCVDGATGEYITMVRLKDGSTKAAEPCNPQAAEEGGVYTFLLMAAAMGYVIADVAADGLTTEYAKAEPIERRGNTQTTAYITRTVGQCCSTVFIAIFMNDKRYNGSFNWGLSFEQVCFCLAIPAALMVPISGCLVVELPRQCEQRMSIRQYTHMCWEMLKSKAFFYVVLYMFLTSAIGGISTTAGVQVKMRWAGVEAFEDKVFTLFGNFLFVFGLYLVKTRFLGASWHMMLIVTMVFLQVVDSIFTTITIFDVFRSPFFYLGEAVLTEIPMAANFVIGTFVIVEMADDGNEGLVYGLLTTAANLGGPISRAIGNQVYALFTPSLSDADNFIEDTPAFRRTVFYSFLLSYGFGCVSLATLYFLPRQKAEAQQWKKTWSRHPAYAWITVVMLASALVYSLAVNLMSMFPETMCLKFAGGDGCD